MTVDMFDEEVDLSTLDSEAAAEVQSFATDVSSSFAASVSSSLGVSANTVGVTCLYRDSDVTKLDLLTLQGFCGSSRKLKAVILRERRLQGQGFGVEIVPRLSCKAPLSMMRLPRSTHSTDAWAHSPPQCPHAAPQTSSGLAHHRWGHFWNGAPRTQSAADFFLLTVDGSYCVGAPGPQRPCRQTLGRGGPLD